MSGRNILHLSVGSGLNSVNVGKFRIGFTRLPSKRDCLFEACSRQCRPSLADVPKYQQGTARTEPNCLVELGQSSVIIATKGIAPTQVPAGELRIGIELKGAREAVSGFLVATGEKLEDG